MNTHIVDKLRKLIDHERSAREINSLFEAELFAKKIQHLLTTHQLSLTDIEIEEEAAIEAGEDNIPRGKAIWQQVLFKNVATANQCDLLLRGRHFVLIGLETDRQICTTLFQYFTELAKDLCNADVVDEREHWWGSGETVRFKNSFLLGFTQALSNRLQQEAASAQQPDSSNNALIHLRNKEALVAAAVAKHAPKEARKRRHNTDAMAWSLGYSRGDSVALAGGRLQQEAA